LVLIFAFSFYSIHRHPTKPVNPASTVPTRTPPLTAPDVLLATNLAQWKALISDLKQDKAVREHWATARFRSGSPPVLLRHNGQSLIYNAAAIDVSTLYHTADFLEAQLYSPKMDIDDARELGSKLCGMFGFETNKFLAWCGTVSNTWLDAPLFGVGDHSYTINVRRSYNDVQPWYIIFTIQSETAYEKLMQSGSP